jgi:hypothetical protein
MPLEKPRKSGGSGTEWNTSALVYTDDVKLLGENINIIMKNTDSICSYLITRMQDKIIRS